MSRQNFLEPFNAKAMTYAEVAKTFVPSSKFAQLAGAWNSVLVGPGARVLTRTPDEAHSAAQVRVSDSRAAFVAA